MRRRVEGEENNRSGRGMSIKRGSFSVLPAGGPAANATRQETHIIIGGDAVQGTASRVMVHGMAHGLWDQLDGLWDHLIGCCGWTVAAPYWNMYRGRQDKALGAGVWLLLGVASFIPFQPCFAVQGAVCTMVPTPAPPMCGAR